MPDQAQVVTLVSGVEPDPVPTPAPVVASLHNLGILTRFMRDDCPENAKVAVIWASSFALIAVLAAVCLAEVRLLWGGKDLPSGAILLFLIAVVGLLLLAGYTTREKK